jgi:hypothetical protein
VTDVLGERRGAELIVVVDKVLKALMVALIVVDLLGFADNAGALAL